MEDRPPAENPGMIHHNAGHLHPHHRPVFTGFKHSGPDQGALIMPGAAQQGTK